MAPEPDSDLAFEQRRRLRRLALPLDLVFWGALLAVFDLTFALQLGDRRAGVDILPDGLGFGLLALGTGMLAFGGWLRGAADTLITAVAVVFAAFFLGSVALWFVPALGALQPWALVLLQVVAAAAGVALCFAMRALALEFGLGSLARSWTIAGVLLLLCYTLPQVLLALTGAELPFALGLLTTVANLVPVIYVFVITYRMKAAAEGALGSVRSSHGTV